MATLTEDFKTDLYRFFAVAFDAAPGYVYWNQLVAAGESGMSIQQVVEVFTQKSQFTDVYPVNMDNAAFAAKLVNNVVGSAATDAAKKSAADMIVAAMNSGYSRGKVVWQIFDNLAKKPETDADWGGTAKQLANQVAYAKYYTETLFRDSTDLGVLRGVIANVTKDSATSVAALEAALNTPASVVSLTTGLDVVSGSVSADAFEAYVVNNSNTLQSGDRIDGGGGTDSLIAVLGSSADFAITPRTVSVENVFIRSQSTDPTNGSSGQNNVQVASGDQVTIDAQDMRGVKQWHNVDSRADLVIEDVRIQEGEITKDIIIRMSNTDPGSMGVPSGQLGTDGARTDFEFYFSPESLRTTTSQSGGVLNLELMDTRSASTGKNPIAENPFNGVKFKLGGAEYLLQSKEIGDATTYTALLEAIRAALVEAKKTKPGLADVTADFGPRDFSATDTLNRITSIGKTITLTNAGSGRFEVGSWVTPNGEVPASAGLHFEQSIVRPSEAVDLITSTIILDNVGRESEAGSLIIGSMSTRTGVERFQITVENNDDLGNTTGKYTDSGSWLGLLSSTNNTLREVIAVNSGVVTSGAPDYLYIGTGLNAAGNNLTTQRLMTNNAGGYIQDPALNPDQYNAGTWDPAAATWLSDVTYQPNVHSDLLNPNGLVDVRLFDASKMTGQVKLGAAINSTAIRKYQFYNGILNDINGDKQVDQVEFKYLTGDGHDAMNITIDGDVAASVSSNGTNTNVGRADFTFLFEGGKGNDHIQVRIVDPSADGGLQNWYISQDQNNNVTINGGDGNDTIRKPSAGDVNIRGDAGNDTIYTDNTARQNTGTLDYNNQDVVMSTGPTVTVSSAGATAHWVVNTTSQSVVTDTLGARELSNLRSDINDSYNLYGAKLTVNFRGLTSEVIIKTANFKTDDLTVNQAIKKAINNDAVLSKLLVAEDGGGQTLIIRALIDGAHAITDLSFALTPPPAAAPGVTGSLLSSEITGAAAAYGVANTELAVLTVMNAEAVKFAARGDYIDRMGTSAGTAVNGRNGSEADSTGGEVTDNTVTGGTGDDVIVLSNTVGVDTLRSSNEVVVLGDGFGNDVVLNFDVGGPGRDAFSVSGIGSVVEVQALATATNGTAALVAAQYATTANAAATNIAHFVFNAATHTASVYKVVDPAGAGAATATLQGTVKLAVEEGAAASPWSSIDKAVHFAAAANVQSVPVALNDIVAAATQANVGLIPTVLNVGGTQENDTFVLWGHFAPTVYANDTRTTANENSGNPGVGARVVTGTIDLGSGTDTLVTYGALDLTGATLTGIENIVANSGLILKASQINSLASVQFAGPASGTGNAASGVRHSLIVVNDLTGTTTLNLSKVVLTSGELLVDTNGTPVATGSGVQDSSATGTAWFADISTVTGTTVNLNPQVDLVQAPVVTTVGSNTATPTVTGGTVTGQATGTGGGTGGGVPG